MTEEKYAKIDFIFEALKKCPLCESEVMIPNGRINWLKTDFWYILCPTCGLKFMNPRPAKETYEEFYKDLFWQQKIRNLGFKQSGQIWNHGRYEWDNNKEWNEKEGRENRIAKHKAQRIQTILPVIEEYLEMNESTSVLEVGSGFGVTLEAIAEKYKSKIFAIEPSKEARKKMEENGKVTILGKYAEELKVLAQKDQKFDCIIFSHSLENTVQPFEALSFAKQCLSDKGLIYIQTPNLLVYDQMNPYHPFIFSQNPLKVAAAKNNMEFIQVSELIEKMLIVLLKNKS